MAVRSASAGGMLPIGHLRNGLTLHVDKTRLIEFGRLAALKRAKLGLPRPRTLPCWASPTTVCGQGTGGSS